MRRLLFPSLALVIALLADLWFGEVVLARVPQPATARFLLIATFLLAWRLRRGRIAWACAALAAFGELGLWFGALSVTAEQPAFREAASLAAAILLALNLGSAAVQREWWLWSASGALRFSILPVQGALIWILTQPTGQRFGQRLLEAGKGAPEWLGRVPLAPPLVATLALAAVVTGLALWRRRSPLEAGLLCALAATTCGLLSADRLRLYLAAAGLALMIALVENAFTLAFQDGLTGLPARRALEERLPQLGRSYALAMLDLDHFKKLNDRHGHEVGDQVLKLVAAMLRRVPGGGKAFRYGGEEFTVVFAGKDAAEATLHLDVLRQQIASRPFTVRSPGRPKKKPSGSLEKAKAVEKTLKVTVSVGVAERSARASTPEEVMKAADKALYKAKKAGRNRVCAA